MINYYKRGISVMELLIVIAILTVIFLIVIPQFSKIREQQVLKSGVQDILSSINKARGETLSSLNSSSYGVHFQSDRIIIFKGITFLVNDVNNETINITTPAIISNIALNVNGVPSNDLFFNRLLGVPSSSGTITISTPNYSKIITISATGIASSN